MHETWQAVGDDLCNHDCRANTSDRAFRQSAIPPFHTSDAGKIAELKPSILPASAKSRCIFLFGRLKGIVSTYIHSTMSANTHLLGFFSHANTYDALQDKAYPCIYGGKFVSLYVHMASENCRDRAQYREALSRMASLESRRAGLLQDEPQTIRLYQASQTPILSECGPHTEGPAVAMCSYKGNKSMRPSGAGPTLDRVW